MEILIPILLCPLIVAAACCLMPRARHDDSGLREAMWRAENVKFVPPPVMPRDDSPEEEARYIKDAGDYVKAKWSK